MTRLAPFITSGNLKSESGKLQSGAEYPVRALKSQLSWKYVKKGKGDLRERNFLRQRNFAVAQLEATQLFAATAITHPR
jgi:hypothetical protein